MKTLRERLQQYEIENGHPIRVGLVGAGQMGTGLIGQMELMDGMKAIAVTDVIPGRSSAAFIEAEVPVESVMEANNASDAEDAITKGYRAALASTEELLKIPKAIVKATTIVKSTIKIAGNITMVPKVATNLPCESTIRPCIFLSRPSFPMALKATTLIRPSTEQPPSGKNCKSIFRLEESSFTISYSFSGS